MVGWGSCVPVGSRFGPSVLLFAQSRGCSRWWPGRGRQLPIAARAGGGEGTCSSLQVRSVVNHPERGDPILAL